MIEERLRLTTPFTRTPLMNILYVADLRFFVQQEPCSNRSHFFLSVHNSIYRFFCVPHSISFGAALLNTLIVFTHSCCFFSLSLCVYRVSISTVCSMRAVQNFNSCVFFRTIA